ncbi:MAG: GAF domain-containing protein [Chloroflexota bacterium]
MARAWSASSTDYYHVLYEVARTINSTLSLQQVLSLVVQSAAKAMDAKACSLRLLNLKRDRLEISAAFGLSESYIAKGPVHVSRSPMDAQALRGTPVVVRNVREDKRLQYPAEVVREGIVSILVVPVTVRDVVIGALRVYTAEVRDFGPEEIEFLSAIANLAGIAIENARVYQTLEEQFEAIRRQAIPWAENFDKPYWRG